MEDTNTTARLPLRKLLQRDAIQRQIEEIDADPEPDLKKKWPKYERLSSLVRKYKEVGEILWPATVLASSAVVLGALWVHAHWPKTYFYSYPDNYLRIVQNVDPCLTDGSCGYRFVVQAVVDGAALPETEMHFCAKGIPPRFEAGHTLAWIRYANLGSCQSIEGFDVVRDSARNPILPDNCKPDYTFAKTVGHINCEGGKAKF